MRKFPQKTIGEIARIIGGGTPTRSNPQYYGGNIPWVTPKDMKSREIWSSKIKITQEGVNNSTTKMAPDKSVLVVNRSGILKHTVPVGVNQIPVAINQDMKALICSDEVDPDYLAYYISHRSSEILKWVRATTADNFPISKLRDMEVPLPSLEFQKKVVLYLDLARSLQEKRRRSIELLDEITQSIFLDMFGDPVANTHSWERKKFREVVANIDSGKSPKCHSTPAREGKWGVLKLGAVTSCEYLPGENKELPETENPKPEHEVQPGDLLFTRKNTPALVGACALVDNTPPRLLLPDLIFRINLKDESVVTKNYLHRLLVHPTKRRKVQELAGGSAASMVNISKSRLLGSEIELPPIELQEEFDTRIRSIQKLKKQHLAHLSHLDELFASVQQRAFDGTLWDDPVMTS